MNSAKDIAAHIGAERSASDRAEAWRVAALEATIGKFGRHAAPPSLLPPLRHWLLFPPVYPLEKAGPDGHELLGAFLPDLGRKRRMWAGSRVRFEAPIALGDDVSKVSRIDAIEEKVGRSGPLVFVRLVHEISSPAGVAIVEEQDLVFREPEWSRASAGATTEAPANPVWIRTVAPDPVMLFRYSALTFNSHRIHYDQPYTTGVESYGGLVVHGPLMATLMADLAASNFPGRAMRWFRFRGVGPALDTAPIIVAGGPGDGPSEADLWVAQEGRLCMRANCGFETEASGSNG
ncbi:MAG: MaoC family dehydratase N-terminal domain-containing protein [Rhizobiaceae bacterium]